MGLHCSVQAFPSCSVWASLVVQSLLLWSPGFPSYTVLASPVATHGFSCPTECGILVPWLGIELASPALEGRFLTTGPPRSPKLSGAGAVFYLSLSLSLWNHSSLSICSPAYNLREVGLGVLGQDSVSWYCCGLHVPVTKHGWLFKCLYRSYVCALFLPLTLNIL